MEYYAKKDDKRRIKFNKKLAVKDIKEGSLVLRYDNRFDYNKSDKFLPHFKVLEKFFKWQLSTNGCLRKTTSNKGKWMAT